MDEYRFNLSSLVGNSWLKLFLDIIPSGLQLPSLVAVHNGLKPAMDLWVPQRKWNSFAELMRYLGLFYYSDSYIETDSPAAMLAFERQRVELFTTTRALSVANATERAEVHVFVSSTKEALFTAVAAGWYPVIVGTRIVPKHFADHDKFGASLGYPYCCRAFFRRENDWHENNCWRSSFSNTHGEPCAYANGLLRHTAYGLVPHIPCSFACHATINQARDLYALIAAEAPMYARAMIDRLSSPTLCLSERQIYRMTGTVDASNVVRYTDVEAVLPTPEADQLVALLSAGNEVRIERNILYVFSGNSLVASYFARADKHAPELPFLITNNP